MNKNEFIKSKTKSFAPKFSFLIGLKESESTSTLLDFMTMLHPNQAKVAQGSRGEVFGEKHFVFKIYDKGILRTETESSKRIFYPF